MTTIRISVTAAHIAEAGVERYVWARPMELALEELAQESVSIDGGDGADLPCVATVSQGAWTLVIDLPAEAGAWLDRRWRGELCEPFEFDLTVDPWLPAFLEKAA